MAAELRRRVERLAGGKRRQSSTRIRSLTRRESSRKKLSHTHVSPYVTRPCLPICHTPILPLYRTTSFFGSGEEGKAASTQCGRSSSRVGDFKYMRSSIVTIIVGCEHCDGVRTLITILVILIYTAGGRSRSGCVIKYRTFTL